MHNRSPFGQSEAQIIEPGEMVRTTHRHGRGTKDVCTEHHHGAELEIVAQTTPLIVDDWCRASLIAILLIAVCINHARMRILHHLDHAFQSQIAQPEGCILRIINKIGCPAAHSGHCKNGFGALERRHIKDIFSASASCQLLVCSEHNDATDHRAGG